MKFRFFFIRLMLVLGTSFGLLGVTQAASLVYQGQICWQNVSSYDQVVVHFQPNGNSDWDSNMTVNGVTIGSTGQGSNYGGQSGYVPGNSINLGWVKVGGCPGWFCASYNPSINYGQCNPTFEDTGVSPIEGYFWFEGYKYVNSTLSVSKSASPYTLTVGASGQYYTIYIGVSNGPTSAAISIVDNLPAGFTTSGAITASGGTLYGCPGAGATSLQGCTISAGAYGPINITVPVNISPAAGSSATNYAYVYGGGDPNCANGCAGGTTNPVTPSSPTLRITKALGAGGRVNSSDQFTVQILLGSTVVNSTTNSTTSGSGTSVSGGTTGVTTLTAGTNYTISEAAAGTTSLAQYGPTVGNCSGTGSSKIPATLGTPFSLANGDAVTCTLTNTQKSPTLSLTKALGTGGRINSGDQFTVQILQGSTVVNSTTNSTTSGSGTSVSGGTTGVTTLSVGTSYTVGEVMAPGSSSILGQYSAAVSCTNAGVGGSSIPVTPGQSFTLQGGDVISCNITNTPKALLSLSKKLGGIGRIGSADQFRVVVFDQGGGIAGAANTSGSGSTVAGGVTNVVANPGTRYMVGEEMVAGSVSNVEQYAYPVSCSNALSVANGGTDVSSIGLGQLFGPLVVGDLISCTVTNTPKLPTITLAQMAPGGTSLVFPVSYSYSGTNGWTTKNVTSTTAGVVGAFTPVQDLSAWNADTVITPAIPAGLKITNAYCQDSKYAINGNSGGFLGSFTDTQFTIPAVNVKAASALVCNVVLGAASPTVTVTKVLNGSRINSSDQFTVQLRNASGTATLASGTTAGSGSTITGGTTGLYTATAGTAYTVNEAMASGSGSGLGQYGAAVACGNTGVGGSDVTGVTKLGDGFTVAAGDVVTCRITNSAALVKLTIKKITTVGTGAFTFNGTPANANGFSTNNSYTVTTTTAGTAASGGPVNLTASNTLTEVQETLPSGWVVGNTGCVDNNATATGNPANFGTLSGVTLQIPAANVRVGSDLVCTFTNVPAPTMTVTQKAIVTAPATFNPPVTLGYTGNNGWAFQQNSNTVVNTVTKGVTQNLAARNVATTLTVAVPTSETGWKIASMRCTDTNAAVSGNPAPPTVLVSSTTNTVTVPAIYVVANAALQCAVIASRLQ